MKRINYIKLYDLKKWLFYFFSEEIEQKSITTKFKK